MLTDYVYRLVESTSTPSPPHVRTCLVYDVTIQKYVIHVPFKALLCIRKTSTQINTRTRVARTTVLSRGFGGKVRVR